MPRCGAPAWSILTRKKRKVYCNSSKSGSQLVPNEKCSRAIAISVFTRFCIDCIHPIISLGVEWYLIWAASTFFGSPISSIPREPTVWLCVLCVMCGYAFTFLSPIVCLWPCGLFCCLSRWRQINERQTQRERRLYLLSGGDDISSRPWEDNKTFIWPLLFVT